MAEYKILLKILLLESSNTKPSANQKYSSPSLNFFHMFVGMLRQDNVKYTYLILMSSVMIAVLAKM